MKVKNCRHGLKAVPIENNTELDAPERPLHPEEFLASRARGWGWLVTELCEDEGVDKDGDTLPAYHFTELGLKYVSFLEDNIEPQVRDGEILICRAVMGERGEWGCGQPILADQATYSGGGGDLHAGCYSRFSDHVDFVRGTGRHHRMGMYER